MITDQDDRQLREYAKRLDIELGEEAYHDLVCDILEKDMFKGIRNLRAFCIVGIKRSLYKIFRHEKAERENMLAFINNDPVPMTVGLSIGRALNNVRREKCRKGLHDLVEGNLVYVGGRRTCKVCKNERERGR